LVLGVILISDLECGAIMDAGNALKLIEPKTYVEAKRLIVAEVSI